jgi:iron complex outermembrane receptor protein
MRGRQSEAGIKWQPARNLLLTMAAYRITETNRQTNDPDNVLNVVQTGQIRSKGVELEGQFQFANDLTITAAVARNEAEVSRSNFALEVGQRLNDTPQDLASAWVSKGFRWTTPHACAWAWACAMSAIPCRWAMAGASSPPATRWPMPWWKCR